MQETIDRMTLGKEPDYWKVLHVAFDVPNEKLFVTVGNAGLGTPEPVVMQVAFAQNFWREMWSKRENKIIPVKGDGVQ